MKDSNNNPEKNTTQKVHQPLNQRDLDRQRIEQTLFQMIAAFEAGCGVAVNSVDLERESKSAYGRYDYAEGLSSYPMPKDPHGPLARIRVTFGEGPLVSTAARAIEEEPLEPTEPAETIEEACLRLAKEADEGEAEVEIVLEEVKTIQEAYLYGGRYA